MPPKPSSCLHVVDAGARGRAVGERPSTSCSSRRRRCPRSRSASPPCRTSRCRSCPACCRPGSPSPSSIPTSRCASLTSWSVTGSTQRGPTQSVPLVCGVVASSVAREAAVVLRAVARADLPVLGVVVERVEAAREVVAQPHRVPHLVRDDREVELLADPLVQRLVALVGLGRVVRIGLGGQRERACSPDARGRRASRARARRSGRTCPCRSARWSSRRCSTSRAAGRAPRRRDAMLSVVGSPANGCVGFEARHLQHVRRHELRLPLRAERGRRRRLELRVERRPHGRRQVLRRGLREHPRRERRARRRDRSGARSIDRSS